MTSRTRSRATWREWLGLLALTLPVFMIATDMTVLYLAIPTITADLQPSATQALWILHVGEFLAAASVITMGRLTDRIGRRRLLTIGVAVYALASVLAARSTTPEMLIGVRALLGIASATVVPSGMALLRSMFADPRQFSVAFALFLSSFSGGMALGPPLGGVLLEHFWWGSVFLANVPAALALLLAAPFLLPSYRDPAAGRLDLSSVGMSAAALLMLIFGLQEIADQGITPVYLAAVVGGLALATAFVRRQRRLDDPLLDLSLFSRPGFTTPLITILVVLFAYGGTDMLFAQHLQIGLGLSPARAGVLLVVPAIASILGTMLAPAAVRSLRPGPAIALGLTVSLAGAAAMAAAAGQERLLPLIVAISVISVGASFAITLGGQLLVTSAPQERTGSASAVNDVSAGLGNALGIAFIGSMATLVYRRGVTEELTTDLASSDRTAVAEGAGNATAVAARLGGQAGEQLMEAVRASFATGLQMAYGLAVALVATVAVASLWRLRHERWDGAPPPAGP